MQPEIPVPDYVSMGGRQDGLHVVHRYARGMLRLLSQPYESASTRINGRFISEYEIRVVQDAQVVFSTEYYCNSVRIRSRERLDALLASGSSRNQSVGLEEIVYAIPKLFFEDFETDVNIFPDLIT